MAFVFSCFKLIFANPLYPEMLFLPSQAFNQHSQGQDSQPLSDSIEPEKSISQESKTTSDGNGFMESPTALGRIARNIHPCVSRVVRKFDSCRNSWVDEVQCKRSHPACSYVVNTHGIPESANQFTASEMLRSFLNVLRCQYIVNVLYKCKCADVRNSCEGAFSQ